MFFCASDVSSVVINSVKSLLHVLKKKFFQKSLKNLIAPVSYFGHSSMKEKHGGKTCFFKFSKKRKKVVHGVYSRKKEFFDTENLKCQCENMKNSIFSILIIKMDRDLIFVIEKSQFPVMKAPKMTTFLGSYLAILSNAGSSDFGEIRGYPYVP